MFKKIFYLVIILFLAGCKKDDPMMSDVPEISFISISPSSVKEYKDKIAIVISYKDGNGDLGENNAAVKNAFITDSRNNVTYEMRIQQLAPDGADIAIQGNLTLEISNTSITNGSSSQSLSYSVKIKDRAGNESNAVTTSVITVNK